MSEEDLEWGFEAYRSRHLPLFLQFETGTKCNTSCIMCPKQKMTRSGTATWKTLLEVIEEGAPHAAEVCPFLYQEPLLEPRLVAILNNIHTTTPNTQITVYTNMAAMTEELARKILKTRALSKLVISFYGPTEEIYNKWQPGLDWETTKENIRRFVRIRNEMGLKKPYIVMHVIAATELLDHTKAFGEEWAPIVDTIGVVPFDTMGGVIPHMGDPEFLFPGQTKVLERLPCHRLWGSLTTLFNGDVVACCLDFNGIMPLGNINEEHIHDIWRGETFNELRRLHLERRFDEIPLCKNCMVWKNPSEKNWRAKWEKHQS